MIGLSFWLGLLYRVTAPALKDPERREITLLFLGGAAAIPFFYLPAFFFGSTSNFTVVDTWRFWIIHLLAMALLVLGLRHVLTEEQWVLPEKFVKFSFWGMNIGLALMVITNLFPEGILQIWDVLENGYWHARSLEFIGSDRIRALEWVSMPSHVILIVVGVVPMVIASGLTYLKVRTA